MFGKGIIQKGILQKIAFVFTWLTLAFIGIGIITLIRRYKEMSFPELNFKKPDFLKKKLEVEYFMIALACSALLVVMVALPFISTGYEMTRLYTVVITILSVFFVIGGISLSKNLSFIKQTFKKSLIKQLSLKKNGLPKKQKDKRRETENGWGKPSSGWAYLVILLVLIPYFFFCVTGVAHQMFGFPEAIILNSKGTQYDLLYVHDQESYGAKWLRDTGELENTKICVGRGIGSRLISQAGILQRDCDSLFAEGRKIDGYIYLRYYNVVDGKIIDAQKKEQNMTEYQDKFVEKGKIYDNGGSEVYK